MTHSFQTQHSVSAVSPLQQHSIHTYSNTSPESPDARYVLFYTATTNDAQHGEIRVLERATGKERVLASHINVEDAHRAACQQWTSGGAHIAFHNVLENGEWNVVVIDSNTGDCRVLAKDRQLGYGHPSHNLVPLYGLHWQQGEHSGLELLHTDTGEIELTNLTADAVRKAYPNWVAEKFADQPISIFFPLLSPDCSRVLFKVATPHGGDYRSLGASSRFGLLCYDLKQSKFLFRHDDWGHPAWHPNSQHIINMGGQVINSATGAVDKIPRYPTCSVEHPSYSPNGKLFTVDTKTDGHLYNGPKGSWAVLLGSINNCEAETVYQFDNAQGAQSWRPSHPHPVFSPDGKRIYFNVSDSRWTRLHVAEIRS